MEEKLFDYDLIIIGAGPAGCSAALGLSESGLKILLLDKARFPRDKTCGDAVPDWALLEMEKVSGGIRDDFLKQMKPHFFNRTSIILPSGQKLTMNWTRPGYMIRRREFDAFLLDRVIKLGQIKILQNCRVNDLIRESDGIVMVRCSNGEEFRTRMLIGADGANSIVSKKLAEYKVPKNQYGSAIRSYFSGANVSDSSETMVFVDKKFKAGYFWIFPLGKGRVNAGFGMLHRKEKSYNSRDAFNYFIEQNPAVREIIQNARVEGDMAGGGLPFALARRSLSGSGFLLTGDAASLVDPFSGDGIQTAAISGVLAAKWVLNAISEDQNNEAFLAGYDIELYARLWPEFRKRARMMKIGSMFPKLISIGIRIGSWAPFSKWLKSWV